MALNHIDAVLELFAPEVDPEFIPTRRARKGMLCPIDDLFRRMMGVLRRHEAFSSCDVTNAIVAAVALPEDATILAGIHVRHGLKHL